MPTFASRVIVVTILALWLAPELARAQVRMPAAGSGAVSGEAGFLFPREDFLDASPTLAGSLEYYTTPRVSVRGTFGWWDAEVDGPGDTGVRHLRLGVNLLYNWERGVWHPFATAGFAAHFIQLHVNDESVGDAETEPALSLGGGIEYFTSATVALKGEALYHFIGEDPGIPDASGLTLTIGLKKYF